MTTRIILAFACLIIAVYQVYGQESFDKQAEREKQFENTSNDDLQAEESKRSPTGKFLLIKGEIHDDEEDNKADLSLLDKLMPSKTKVIIDGGMAFPFPPPPPPPIFPPQFILPPPPHPLIPSIFLTAPSTDFGPLPLPQMEQKPEEDPNANPQNIGPDQSNVVVGDSPIEQQQKPNMDGMMKQDEPMGQDMMNPQKFPTIMTDMQPHQSDWTNGRFRMGGADTQQQSEQPSHPFQGIMQPDMQQQEQPASSQHFPGSSLFDTQPDQSSQRFPGMMGSMQGDSGNTNMQSQQDSSWSPSRFGNSDSQQSEPQGGSQHGSDFGSGGESMMSMMLPGMSLGKGNKKNKDKGKNGQKSGSNIPDMKPEPEPPGCSCGPMFNKSGWGHVKRCAKRCAGHHHHHESHSARAVYSTLIG